MPTDKAGKFHLNTQRAMAADKAPPQSKPLTQSPAAPMSGDSAGMSYTTLHDHGDGTFHTEGHDGQQEQHPHIGHALMHMAGKHGEGAKHMHVHSDGMTHATHHNTGGGVEGPHEHADTDAMKEHVGQVMGEGQTDWGGKDTGGKDSCGSGGGY